MQETSKKQTIKNIYLTRNIKSLSHQEHKWEGKSKVQVTKLPFDHWPVDEAMPERLPQARLTTKVESSGLMSTDNQY